MNKKQLRILIAPLDWGLGHVTRCVPIIRYILSLGHQVVFAGNESQKEYLKRSFSKIEYLNLEGYNVKYSKSKLGLVPKIISQIPRLNKTIKQEHLWLQSAIKSHHIDAVISDNRYGLFSNMVPCVIMTHQLQILSGYGGLIDHFLLRSHYRFLEKFQQCWVVDTADNDGLSGILGHPKVLPKIKTSYLGLLSQCIGKEKKNEEESYVLILLSGAEPQRSILADLLWKKAIKSDKFIIFVAGSDNAVAPSVIPEHISFHKRLNAEELSLAINVASIVICRSGYSSLMDLLAMNKKAILIPTPGQTEQEYLAKRMHRKKIFMSSHQNKFDIQTSLINAALFPFRKNDFNSSFDHYRTTIDSFLKELAQTKTK